VELDAFLTPDEIIASGKLKDLRRRARSECGKYSIFFD
jgi:hypothetical protein